MGSAQMAARVATVALMEGMAGAGTTVVLMEGMEGAVATAVAATAAAALTVEMAAESSEASRTAPFFEQLFHTALGFLRRAMCERRLSTTNYPS